MWPDCIILLKASVHDCSVCLQIFQILPEICPIIDSFFFRHSHFTSWWIAVRGSPGQKSQILFTHNWWAVALLTTRKPQNASGTQTVRAFIELLAGVTVYSRGSSSTTKPMTSMGRIWWMLFDGVWLCICGKNRIKLWETEWNCWKWKLWMKQWLGIWLLKKYLSYLLAKWRLGAIGFQLDWFLLWWETRAFSHFVCKQGCIKDVKLLCHCHILTPCNPFNKWKVGAVLLFYLRIHSLLTCRLWMHFPT